MLCNQCGSTRFEEENGLFYCCFCQTQSQGFTQESGGDFLDISKLLVKEVGKKRVKRVVQKKTGVLWTTTEAFNLILFKQINRIFQFTSDVTDLKDMIEMTKLVWFTYLNRTGLAVTDDESQDTQVINRRLHPASRFRDVQILTNRVDNSLPPFKNGSTQLGFCKFFGLGSDCVVRNFRDSQTSNDLETKLTEEENKYELLDIFYYRYRDPRKYGKINSNGMKIPKESRKQLRHLLSKMSLDVSAEDFEIFDNLDNENVKSEENVLRTELSIDEDIRNSPKSKASINSSDSIGSHSFDGDYDKELMKNLTETTKLYSQYIPLSHLKESSNINSNYFIDLMSLPKTLAVLNIVFRLLGYNIYCCDLIRWANESHIPYYNCLVEFPEDWVLIGNDVHTFTSFCIPSQKTISILSAKIANHIGINSFPRPNIEELLIRFAKDLNLPKDIVKVISTHYSLFEHFPQKLNKMSIKLRTTEKMPNYEMWALMSILLVLKRIFILKDSPEKRLSDSARNETQLFIWSEWEDYSRHRVELIRSNFIPSYSGDLEDIKDPNLIDEHYLEMSTLPTCGLNKNSLYKHLEFKNDVQQEFKEFLFQFNETEEQSSEAIVPSLYPLTNATNFALNRVNSPIWTKKMLISFEDKEITPWICGHGKFSFHRGYEFLSSDQTEWSQSFKLLIDLSCFILNCKIETLKPILRHMETRYFGKRR